MFFFSTVPDNKFRILKNGGVAAILAAMRTYKTEEQLQANGLKALCNLLESRRTVYSHTLSEAFYY